MTTKQILNEIDSIVERCDNSTQQQVIKAVLLTLIGSVVSGFEESLLDVTDKWTKEALQILNSMN